MLIKRELSGKKYGTTKSFESSLLKYHNLVFFYLVFLHHSMLWSCQQVTIPLQRETTRIVPRTYEGMHRSESSVGESVGSKWTSGKVPY